MENIGLKPDQNINGKDVNDDLDEDINEEDERDWDEENEYRRDLMELNERG